MTFSAEGGRTLRSNVFVRPPGLAAYLYCWCWHFDGALASEFAEPAAVSPSNSCSRAGGRNAPDLFLAVVLSIRTPGRYIQPGCVMDDEKQSNETAATRRAKLIAHRDALNRRIAAIDAKTSKKHRNEETRRNILAGACIRNKAAKDHAIAMLLDKELRAYLSRPDDRALFNLPSSGT